MSARSLVKSETMSASKCIGEIKNKDVSSVHPLFLHICHYVFSSLSFARKVGFLSYGNCWYIGIPHLQAVYILFSLQIVHIALQYVFYQKQLALYIIAYRRVKGTKLYETNKREKDRKKCKEK
jgi:hypothetical protein